MSRYIKFDCIKTHYRGGFHDSYVVDYDSVMNAPSIDIVRCRECKYWKSTVQMPNGTEVKCLYGRKADDFCSYGEREDE